MKTALLSRRNQILMCLIIGLCFMWTGSGYLSWLYNLIDNCPDVNADIHSEVIGYLFQALGIGLFAIAIKANKKLSQSVWTYLLISVMDLLLICCASMIYDSTCILVLGYMSNVAHGLVAGFYLNLLIQYLPPMQRGLCFGVGYAIGSLGSYLLSIIGDTNFLTTEYVWIAYAGMIVISVPVLIYLLKVGGISETDAKETKRKAENDKNNKINGNHIIGIVVLASICVLLISLVKNLGFYFPMADIESGDVNLEFTRLFYAIGLILAGLINDVNRKYGIFICLITLFVPFLLPVLGQQYHSSLIIWIIEYSFTGFYTVYRVLLLGDLIKDRASLYFISGFGLLFGRVGDALGALIGIRMSGNTVALECITVAFYISAAIIIMLLFERIYIPDIIKGRRLATEAIVYEGDFDGAGVRENQDETEDERFAINFTEQIEDFANKYELSKREQDILRLALTDMTNINIANELFISVNTTKFHIRNILKKTGCANRNELKQLYNQK